MLYKKEAGAAATMTCEHSIKMDVFRDFVGMPLTLIVGIRGKQHLYFPWHPFRNKVLDLRALESGLSYGSHLWCLWWGREVKLRETVPNSCISL